MIQSHLQDAEKTGENRGHTLRFASPNGDFSSVITNGVSHFMASARFLLFADAKAAPDRALGFGFDAGPGAGEVEVEGVSLFPLPVETGAPKVRFALLPALLRLLLVPAVLTVMESS